MPTEPLAPSISLVYRGLCTRVHSADTAELAWLEEFLAPAFTRDDRTSAHCQVVVCDDADRLAALRSATAVDDPPLTCLVLDGGPLRLPARSDGRQQLVRDDEAGVVYAIAGDRRRVEVVSASASAARRTAVMKLVRELAMSAAWSPRSLVLHAAACAIGGEAILIAGPKGAGKSSLLLHALSIAGARLLANDRVVLERDSAGTVAHGMPTIVNLRADTVAARFADESARRAAYRYQFPLTVAEAERRAPATHAAPRPLTCSPPQLGRLLGVELVGRANAAAVILPRIAANARGIAWRRLDVAEAARRLPEVLLAAAQMPPPISDVFAPPEARPPSSAELHRLWHDCIQRVRVFDCQLGPNAYAEDAATSLLAPILA